MWTLSYEAVLGHTLCQLRADSMLTEEYGGGFTRISFTGPTIKFVAVLDELILFES